jgi:chromosome segregation ATPase
MGEKIDKAVEEVRKAVEEEMKAARAEGKVVKVIETTTTTITDEQSEQFESLKDRLDSSPRVNELEDEIRHLKRQVVDQIGNIEALLGQRKKLEEQADELKTDKKKLKFLVKFWETAAKCEKPRGSCRACKTENCFFKKKAI